MNKYIKEFEKMGVWKCQDCGIGHSHHPELERHNIKNKVNNNLNFNPYCHCGIHEAVKLYDENKLNADEEILNAIENNHQRYYPIPTHIKKQIYQ